MKPVIKIALSMTLVWSLSACVSKNNLQMLDPNQTTTEKIENKKLVIYQTLVRHFGNQNNTNKFYGSIAENGSGKFNDITDKALNELKKMGVNYVWYTGVIEHATMTDYTKDGIKADDPDIVKGRAGSPYAIKDYYDVDPDLAVDVKNRMAEYEALIKRTHDRGLKVLMDFIPNHVARTYHSDVKPTNVVDLGANDNTSKSFDPTNDFYYIPNQQFVVPVGYNPGGDGFKSTLKDGRFEENPAKATGNNVFSPSPKIDDWFETIKLNYGLDIQHNNTKNFVPQPPVWKKMRDILAFWASKGVDGFRCDMVEMVPVEFWSWAISDLKKKYPQLIFIGEAYDRNEYKNFLVNGKFDFLYDKVGLYDGIKRLMKAEDKATVKDISTVWQKESNGFSQHMLRFLENHDEERIASKGFAGNPWYAVPAMVVTATLSSGPVMIYNGQEVGEPALGAEGFGGDDNRSSIFDYWGLPQHQKWMNKGAFDGGLLNEDEKKLRQFYSKLLQLVNSNEAIAKGNFYELLQANQGAEGFNDKVYAYLRYTENKRVLVLANFNRNETKLKVKLPKDVLAAFDIEDKAIAFRDLLSQTKFSTNNINEGLNIFMPATSAVILEF
ncbi:alpha-amylase family glycosyl hydrolase [Pedobacter sp. Hv1]|uniref:alpha-amylase family glycosyl hydrolase n=1 Tax=Pedobacter sp. Hv1 TaxID=1740090 RepID=UPI0006D8B690|nr:alpha-amylase family glycosyl hydrolase [Pedobacter sp. Hv1]KQC02378.1 alpha-amylase [Pedobacter sp. Hv1]